MFEPKEQTLGLQQSYQVSFITIYICESVHYTYPGHSSMPQAATLQAEQRVSCSGSLVVNASSSCR